LIIFIFTKDFLSPIYRDASGPGMCYGAFAVQYFVPGERAREIDVPVAYARGDVEEARATKLGNRIIRRKK